MVSQRRRQHRYEDDLGREKRVDRSALFVIAKHSQENDREVFVLDTRNPPERIGNRRKKRS
jgi:hypothetical protein